MRTIAIVGVCVLVTAGCGGDSKKEFGGGGPTPVVVGLDVTPPNNLLRIGAEQAYSASVRWSDGRTTVESAAWSSDAPAVATIDGGGRARGVDTGEATLVGTFREGTGTLRIRVLPNYEGQWSGASGVRNCRPTGDWSRTDVCKELRGFGQLATRAGLTQDRDHLAGTFTLDDIEAPITDGTIRGDGSAAVTARLVETDDGVTFTFAFEPIELRAQGSSMTSAYTMTVTASTLSGDFKADFDPSLSRTAGIAFQTAGMPGGLRGRITRLMKPR